MNPRVLSLTEVKIVQFDFKALYCVAVDRF